MLLFSVVVRRCVCVCVVACRYHSCLLVMIRVAIVCCRSCSVFVMLFVVVAVCCSCLFYLVVV